MDRMAALSNTPNEGALDTIVNVSEDEYGHLSLQSLILDLNIDTELKEASELISIEAFKQEVIQDGNSRQFNNFLPVFVYICVLMAVGLPGNMLAFLVYKRKLKKAIARPFLMTLCSCGFLSCAIVMPMELDIMRRFYDYDQTWLCKSLRLFAYTVNNVASLTLLAIAVERYRIICTPWKLPFSNTLSRRICYVNIVLSALFSIPMVFVYGIHTVPMSEYVNPPSPENEVQVVQHENTTFPDFHKTKNRYRTENNIVVGKSCSMDDNMKYSNFPMIVVSIYISTIVLEFLILIGFYSQVTRLLAKRRKESMCHQKAESKRTAQKRVVRVTIMTVVLTVAYEICYLPCLIAVCIRLIKPNFYYLQSNVGKMLFNMCLKSYLLDSALYPFIYCYYNNEFRKGLCKLLRTFKSTLVKREGDTISPISSKVDHSHNSVM